MSALSTTDASTGSLSVAPSNVTKLHKDSAIVMGQVIDEVTTSYLDTIDPSHPSYNQHPRPTPQQIEEALLIQVNKRFDLANAGKRGADRILRLKALTFTQVAMVLMRLHHVVRIAPSDMNTDRDYDLLAIYAEDGPSKGTYITSDDDLKAIMSRYNHEMNSTGKKEVLLRLREDAPRVSRCLDRNLIPVNNGIFNYETKELLPFSPDLVFPSKSATNLDMAAVSPLITNDDDGSVWEIEEWMRELSDDPEIVELLWEIMGAIVRPTTRWNKSAWFFSETGNNGKGTLCSLMRNLVGQSACASLPIADFGKEFLLEPLTKASAIIVDENDVGLFIDKAANLKAVVTNDVISINRKHKQPISYQFWGFMVQCLNEFPKIKDKSDSFYRRQLFVRFEKCFTGVERIYIKADYLRRPDVLEYVLKRVLVDMPAYYALSVPKATTKVLDEFKQNNDPVRQYWAEFEGDFAWDLLPFPFLYDHYLAWFAKVNPSGKPEGRNKFISDLLAVVKSSQVWYCADKDKRIRSNKRMGVPEMLILKYDLADWKEPGYTGKDPRRMCTPIPATYYSGLQRFATASTTQGQAGNDDTDQTD